MQFTIIRYCYTGAFCFKYSESTCLQQLFLDNTFNAKIMSHILNMVKRVFLAIKSSMLKTSVLCVKCPFFFF